MTISLKTLGDRIFQFYIYLVMVWIIFALGFQIFGVYLHFTNQEDLARQISNEISWKIDGTFKDNPDNIWYEEPSK